MARVLHCLQYEHDWRLVLLAAVVCFFASLAAVSMYQQARGTHGRVRLIWVLVAGVAAGGGVWATHFIAELAYKPGYPVSFDSFITVLSLLVGVVVTIAGVAVAAYVPHRMSAALGGAVAGLGYVGLHYLGMNAMQIPATISWETDLLTVSIAAVVILSAAALDMASRSDRMLVMTFAGCLLAFGILVLHFAGMAAVILIPDALRAVSPYSMSPETLSFAIAGVAACVLGMCLVGAFFDRRARRDIGEKSIRLDGALNNMNQGLCMFDAQNRLVVWNARYQEMYSIAPDRIWVGCTVSDLLNARIAAGTFPLDPKKYGADLREALKQGKVFVNDVELKDGRTIAVVNQPMESGGWVATHEDITERIRADRELSRTRAFLDTIVSNVPTPIIVKSLPDLKYLLINKAAEKFFGRPGADLLGKTVFDLFEPAAAEAVHQRDLEILKTGHETFCGEHSVVTPTGDARVVTSTRLPVMGVDGTPQYMISVIHDLTDRKRDEAQISYLAHHDTMTSLPNRVAFNQCLDSVVGLASSSSESFGLLVIDVDRFKTINDTFGSQAGDTLLRKLSGRLQEACEGAFLARIGGDELAVISPTGPQPRTAEDLARRLSRAAASDFDIDGHPVNAGVTIGVAVFPTDGPDGATLQANAEAALVRAKAERRGSIRFFEAQMDQQLREKRALQHDLRAALANEELELYYQPQAEMDGTIVGFEALVRWHHPRRGMVPPSTFIPLAEESGLIIALGDWVLRTACREAASWPRPLRIAVNMSPVQFQHGDPANMVHSVLFETGLAPNRLELEVTEGVLIGDFSRAMSILRRLKSLGVRIDMDDFGTGYSSLSYLQSFPFDKIKVDQCFVANVMQNPQSAAIVRAVIGLGKGLGLPVIAEGVETKEQLAFLADAKCDGVQGYLIGRPQPIAHYADIVGKPAPGRKVLAAAS
jgi:diguanylate cyclase (GGDEF)-like protein/PAS domain S-box-containing protein